MYSIITHTVTSQKDADIPIWFLLVDIFIGLPIVFIQYRKHIKFRPFMASSREFWDNSAVLTVILVSYVGISLGFKYKLTSLRIIIRF